MVKEGRGIYPLMVFHLLSFLVQICIWSLNSPECIMWPLWTAAGETRSDTPELSEDTPGCSASSESKKQETLGIQSGWPRTSGGLVHLAMDGEGRPC